MSDQGPTSGFDLEDAEWDLRNSPRTTTSSSNGAFASVDHWEVHSGDYFEQIPRDIFNNPISLLEWLNAHPNPLDHEEDRSANRNESHDSAKRDSNSHNMNSRMVSLRKAGRKLKDRSPSLKPNQRSSFYSAPISSASIPKHADDRGQYAPIVNSWQERPRYNRKTLGKKIKCALVDQIGYDTPCYISRAGTIIRKARIDWRDYRYSRFLDMLIDFSVDNGGFICFGPCEDGKHTHQKIWIVR